MQNRMDVDVLEPMGLPGGDPIELYCPTTINNVTSTWHYYTARAKRRWSWSKLNSSSCVPLRQHKILSLSRCQLLSGDQFPRGFRAPKPSITLIVLGFTILRVGTVQPIDQTPTAEALVESVESEKAYCLNHIFPSSILTPIRSLLEVMIIVSLGAAQHRQMVSRMGRQGVVHHVREPNQGCYKVALHQADAQQRWNHVAKNVLDRMGVQSGPRDRCSELVMLFVNDPVQVSVVQQSVTVVEANLPQDNANEKVAQDFERRWQDSNVRICVLGEQVEEDVRQRKAYQDLIDKSGFYNLKKKRFDELN